MRPQYEQLRREMMDSGYSGKCTVIAISILYGLPFHEALRAMDNQRWLSRGEPPKKHGGYSWGMWRAVNEAMAERNNAVVVALPLEQVRRHAKTTRTFTTSVARKLGVRDGYIETHGHVSAIKDYRIEDWADNRCKRITRVVKLVYRDNV